MRQITKFQSTRLSHIKQLAEIHQKILDDLVEEAEHITKESEGGFTFDFILNNFGTKEELLEKLGIEVGA